MSTTQYRNELLRPLGSTGLRCHPLGFGCYRVADGNAAHEQSLREYLARGGNLVDTSANYGDGRSEILVGKILRDFPRERVILVTKGGYIQGQNMALAHRRNFPEVVEYGDGLWHSIHPEFLETQITMSAERLQQSFIDVYLLHNPEYYLEHQAHQKSVGKAEHKEFYRRIEQAFRFLEMKVGEGQVGWYGISSNNFGMPASTPTATSVKRCWEIAESLSSNHHFRIIQLPLNLYEGGGALEPNNDGRTVLEFCRHVRIGVLINRPLNAFVGNRLKRLADFVPPGEQPPSKEQLHLLLAPLRKLEEQLEHDLGMPLIYGEGSGIANYLEVVIPQLKSPAHWEEIFAQKIMQPIQRWVIQCHQLYDERADFEQWWKQFARELVRTLEEMPRYLAAAEQAASNTIRARLQVADYSAPGQSLSRMAQNVLLHLPGVSCVLNGMRRPDYVHDSMGVANLEAVDSLAILREFQRTD